MRKFALASVLFALSVQSQKPASAPEVKAPPPLVEKIDVSVVNVDVTVTDRHGQPVRNLTRDDFEIIEDGKPQPISNFYVVENAEARTESGPAAASAPPPERFRRKVLVLVDNLNTSVHGRNEALARLEEFINQHFDDGRYDWSIATVDSRVHLLLPMTSDKKILHDVVAEIRRGGTKRGLKAPIARGESVTASSFSSITDLPGDAPSQRVQATKEFQTQNKNFDEEMALTEQTMFAGNTTDAVVDAARAFGSSEGRKMILLVTGYMPFSRVSPLHRMSSGLGNHMEEINLNDRRLMAMRDRIIREANASNTSFYIINGEGMEVGASGENVTKATMATPSDGSSAPDTSAMYWVAGETGGAYLPSNRIDQSLTEFDRRAANFYSLGFAPKHAEDARYHRIVVNLKGHPELKLQYRDGYSSAETDLKLARALRSPLGATMQEKSMKMSLIIGDPQYRGLTALVPLAASMSMESLQYITDARGSRTRLHVYVSIFDSDGRNLTLAKSFVDVALKPNEAATGPMTITIPALSLGKGTYNVVVAVRDELTDHVGVATHKIQV